MIHLDTSLLIDLLRETALERPGPAFDVMESIADEEILAVSVHVVCELRVAAELSRRAIKEHETVDQLLGGLLVVYPDDRFAPMYGRLLATMKKAAPPTMDVLIATAALVDDAPLITRNARDFARVPGLRLMRY